jgi:hypothetical protein
VAYRADKSHINYVRGFMDQLDMVCYSKASIAFMPQLYFIGYSSRIILIAVPQKIGLVKFIKFFVIPLNILSYSLSSFAPSYALRCIGFFLTGMLRIKMMIFLVVLKDQAESKYSSWASTVAHGLDAYTLSAFCLYM